MQNCLAVYTTKRAINGRKLVDIARSVGIDLRFLALGGQISSNTEAILSKSLVGVNGGGLLIVGGFEEDQENLIDFDIRLNQGDQPALARKLNGGLLPWCELYSHKFNYEKACLQDQTEQAKLDGSVTQKQLPLLKAAKYRYLIYNQSRKKKGSQLMKVLTPALAEAVDGIVADYQR
ncbi:hypothetical protein [Gimesia sp.]|uniref:hypothetical protein n=1 Tax=Gimesia sp. TaxID=2024833 RepID=UPI003A930D3F